jgi:hypothetical protein
MELRLLTTAVFNRVFGGTDYKAYVYGEKYQWASGIATCLPYVYLNELW